MRVAQNRVAVRRGYADIAVGGGDTSVPLAMAKRLAVIARYVRPGSGRFLDCGCGRGEYVLELMDRLRLDTFGIEFDSGKVAAAHANPLLRSRVRIGDLQSLDSPDETWDFAMLNEVLEHVPDDGRALREVHRALRPGAVLFVFSPNRWFPFETHGTHMKRSGRRVPHWIPFVPYLPLPIGSTFLTYWARNYWQRELAALVNGAGFEVIERTFVWQTFEGISGRQPAFVAAVAPVLRRISNLVERTPVLRRFGVSQALVCRKPG